MLGSLDIIVVNWNSGGQLYECLKSIAASDRTGIELKRVVVVDNASGDGSTECTSAFEIPLRVVMNSKNLGFSFACNQGAQGSSADFLLFLNPDVYLCRDSLGRPLAFMKEIQAKDIGIVGIQLVDERGEVARSCARFPTPGRFVTRMFGLDRLFPMFFRAHFMTEWDHRDSRIVDQIIGAFFMVRRSVYEMLGGFDSRFFVYYEDVDFSLRAREAGFRSYFLSDVQAVHRGGGTSEQVKPARLFYSLRSRIRFCYKHYDWLGATAVTLGTLFIEPFTRTLVAVFHGSFEGVLDTLRGYAMLWRSILRGNTHTI